MSGVATLKTRLSANQLFISCWCTINFIIHFTAGFVKFIESDGVHGAAAEGDDDLDDDEDEDDELDGHDEL